MSIKRLQPELKQMIQDPNYLYSVSPVKDNFYKWDIIMIGAPDTIFEGVIIKAIIEFPKEYPNKAQQFKFITPLYHPNVYIVQMVQLLEGFSMLVIIYDNFYG